MLKDYIHPDLNEEVTAIGGHYVSEKEELIPVNGKEILYILGHAVIDTSCCGMGGGRFAVVPGYIVRYRYRTDESGRTVSQVEPVEEDWEIKKAIIGHIEKKESFCSVRFLG